MRDLSSSRTPEASIAAALSRDTTLFERTAPSTYCVRAQFRKDGEDADEVLTAARDRIRLFQNGLVDGEEADKDGDEADREEYESDGQDVDDVEVRLYVLLFSTWVNMSFSFVGIVKASAFLLSFCMVVSSGDGGRFGRCRFRSN